MKKLWHTLFQTKSALRYGLLTVATFLGLVVVEVFTFTPLDLLTLAIAFVIGILLACAKP